MGQLHGRYNKWEPEEGLLTCDDMIRDYKVKNGLAEKAVDMVNW